MKAQELRIGNWVQGKVSFPPYEGVKLLHQVNSMMIRDCEHYKDNWSCEPIPLTPEILEKCGFEWSIYHQAFHKIGFVFDLSERHVRGYYLHISRNNSVIICPEILHLHKLQNLIYALTGEELELLS